MHGLARSRLPNPDTADHKRYAARGVLLPPLLIGLAIVSAASLLLTAAAIAPPPLPAAVAGPAPPATPRDTPFARPTITILGQTAGMALPLTSSVVDLARLIYAPGAGGSRRALPGPLLLLVESGALTVDLGGAAQLINADRMTPVAAGRYTLRSGDGLALPLAISATFANDGTAPAVALAAGVFPAAGAVIVMERSGPARWASDWSPGATVDPLVGGWVVDATPASAFIALRRLSLPVGGSAPLAVRGPAVLATEAGVLSMVALRGVVWRQPPSDPAEWIDTDRETTLTPSDGALLGDDADVTLRNAGSGPALALVLTFEQAANQTLSPRATNLATPWPCEAPDDAGIVPPPAACSTPESVLPAR